MNIEARSIESFDLPISPQVVGLNSFLSRALELSRKVREMAYRSSHATNPVHNLLLSCRHGRNTSFTTCAIRLPGFSAKSTPGIAIH
jgi:hypothetical protein